MKHYSQSANEAISCYSALLHLQFLRAIRSSRRHAIIVGKFLIAAQDVTATFCASKTHKVFVRRVRSADVDSFSSSGNRSLQRIRPFEK